MTPRPLRRSGREMPPLLWEWTGASEPDVLRELARCKATWVYVREALAQPLTGCSFDVVLGLPADALQPRRGAIVRERLAALGLARCAGVMIRHVTPGEVKAGGPFHRLSQLRDEGTIQLFFVEAEDHATAEWLVHHTPAHAVAIPFSLEDLTAKYRLVRDAAGFGTGIIARPAQPVWSPPKRIEVAASVSFLASEEAVSSILLPLPRDVDELRQLVEAFENPMPEEEREEWWAEFQRQVPEPPPPDRGVAPDFA